MGWNEQLAAEAEEEVRRYVRGYCGALWDYVTEGTQIDYEALGFWSFPILMISGTIEACRIDIRDAASLDAMVKPGYEHYFRDGWDGRVEVHTAKAKMSGSTFATVKTTGSRYRADDSINSSWECAYLMRRDHDGWKHIGVDSALPLRAMSEWGAWLGSLASKSVMLKSRRRDGH
jgi:hypothetical protein